MSFSALGITYTIVEFSASALFVTVGMQNGGTPPSVESE